MTITQAELDAIRARAEAATEGPWVNDDDVIKAVNVLDRKYDDPIDIAESSRESVGDAEFIAHSRQDVPKLLAEVERLQEKVATYEALAQENDYYDILAVMVEEELPND